MGKWGTRKERRKKKFHKHAWFTTLYGTMNIIRVKTGTGEWFKFQLCLIQRKILRVFFCQQKKNPESIYAHTYAYSIQHKAFSIFYLLDLFTSVALMLHQNPSSQWIGWLFHFKELLRPIFPCGCECFSLFFLPLKEREKQRKWTKKKRTEIVNIRCAPSASQEKNDYMPFSDGTVNVLWNLATSKTQLNMTQILQSIGILDSGIQPCFALACYQVCFCTLTHAIHVWTHAKNEERRKKKSVRRKKNNSIPIS